MKDKIKVKINYPIFCGKCPKCKKFDYIIGVGCKNCDLKEMK